ncbi:hypothetical protein CPHO_12380 [Corynebacterium phocae]|uniref:Uncharacterized protein n=1 Tax=Corynebacterium phocae TaxID=161895 RepID=A0A1L7D5Y5_9CORY|nr:hypothetical protein [Corynebacterium phocae]APT93554.1 hypothetical protein CPHO_12380 [Corynebacterium phocae]KAA8720644.1 hypothetical protein F4V58_11820 [Corynebacterium phocae]
MWVQPVTEGVKVHPLAARSVFWEIKTTVADPAFEKEAWVTRALVEFGECGFTIQDSATVYFCSPELAQGAAKLPTAPVAEDAAVITSLFADPGHPGLEAIVLDAAVMNLVARDFTAVEAFGYRDFAQARKLLGEKPPRIGLMPVETLEAAGFRVVRDHPITPRLRMELPPPFELLTVAAMDDLLARAMV